MGLLKSLASALSPRSGSVLTEMDPSRDDYDRAVQRRCDHDWELGSPEWNYSPTPHSVVNGYLIFHQLGTQERFCRGCGAQTVNADLTGRKFAVEPVLQFPEDMEAEIALSEANLAPVGENTRYINDGL